ncbi:MAG: DUF4321 domain-containing protein [Nitrospinota bacterium]
MRGRAVLTFLILTVIGGILGGLAGVALNLTLSGTRVVKYLTTPFNVGIDPPWRLTLSVIQFTFGLKLELSPIVILGVAIGGLFYRKF